MEGFCLVRSWGCPDSVAGAACYRPVIGWSLAFCLIVVVAAAVGTDSVAGEVACCWAANWCFGTGYQFAALAQVVRSACENLVGS